MITPFDKMLEGAIAFRDSFAEYVKENGEMLTHNSIKFLARTIRDDLHIPFKFHNLRHTYATILAESGISPRYVQEMYKKC